MSLSAQKCCVPGCMESGNSHTTLHLFPNPNKDRERFNIWVFSVMGDIIGSPNEEVYKLRRVCHAHFEEKYCCRYNRISNIAVPTLNLPRCYKGKTCKKNLTVTRAEQLLYNKLMQARIKLSKCRNKRKQQSASLKAAKNLASNVIKDQ